MKCKKYLLPLLSLLSFPALSQSPQILNGVPAEKGEFPFFVALNTQDGAKDGHHCGAALINNNWVITAAHCINTSKQFVAMVGLEQYAPSAVYKDKVEVAEIFLHPKWSTTKNEGNDRAQKIESNWWYDIALLKLSRPANSESFIKLNGIDETIALPPGKALTVTGFGKNENEVNPDVLMKTGENILQDSACIDVPSGNYPPTNYDPEFNICSGNKLGAAYRGDSGGPIMVKNAEGNNVLAALVSRSLVFPAEQNTKVSAHAQWIKDTLANN